jgi:hypothetical protein
VNADVVYVQSDIPTSDLVAFGISGIQRIQGFNNTYNTSLHILGSFPTNGDSAFTQQGELLFAQTSWTPHHYEDLIYLNTFLAIDQFAAGGAQVDGLFENRRAIFAGLAQIDVQAMHVVAFFLKPIENHRGVEAAGIGE